MPLQCGHMICGGCKSDLAEALRKHKVCLVTVAAFLQPDELMIRTLLRTRTKTAARAVKNQARVLLFIP